MTTELDTFYEMVEDIGIAMMTTRRPDGHLESRAMANQKRARPRSVTRSGSKREPPCLRMFGTGSVTCASIRPADPPPSLGIGPRAPFLRANRPC